MKHQSLATQRDALFHTIQSSFHAAAMDMLCFASATPTYVRHMGKVVSSSRDLLLPHGESHVNDQ